MSAPVTTELCSGAVSAPLQEEDRTDISLIMHTLLPSDPAKPSGQITKGSDINSMAPLSLFNLQTSLPRLLTQSTLWALVEGFTQKAKRSLWAGADAYQPMAWKSFSDTA